MDVRLSLISQPLYSILEEIVLDGLLWDTSSQLEKVKGLSCKDVAIYERKAGVVFID